MFSTATSTASWRRLCSQRVTGERVEVEDVELGKLRRSCLLMPRHSGRLSLGAGKNLAIPTAHREVAPIVSDAFSTEDARDRRLGGGGAGDPGLRALPPGMSVADIGAGEGYYTVRLAPLSGQAAAFSASRVSLRRSKRAACHWRVHRRTSTTWPVKLGAPGKSRYAEVVRPHLPRSRLSRGGSPYAFLWHMRREREGEGKRVIVDANPGN